MILDDPDNRRASNWDEIHDRRRPEDIARMEYLNATIELEELAGARDRRQRQKRNGAIRRKVKQ